jgi:hypothetical protein
MAVNVRGFILQYLARAQTQLMSIIGNKKCIFSFFHSPQAFSCISTSLLFLELTVNTVLIADIAEFVVHDLK